MTDFTNIPGLVNQTSVAKFGVKGDGVTDDTAALQAARDWLAAQTLPAKLVFPAGRYLYSVSPNWAISDAIIEAQGEVRLRYTGIGNAVILDGGAAGAGVRNLHFGGAGRFIVEAPATALDGFYVRAVHTSKVRGKVVGCGSASAGLRALWCVITEFDVVVSVNEEGWYAGAKPAFGYLLDTRGGGSDRCSYCYFPNPIVEGPNIGVQLGSTLGNLFIGGTFEACSLYGIFATSAAANDKFVGTDMEVNTAADVYCQGKGIEFIGIDTADNLILGPTAQNCLVSGGRHKNILCDAGSIANVVTQTKYNRANTGGTLSDVGNGNRLLDNVDDGNLYIDTDAHRYTTLFDDFLGDTINPGWGGFKGTDAQALAPALAGSVLGGYVRLTGGDDAAASMDVNGSQLDQGVLQWRCDNGGLEIEARLKLDAITQCAWFFGMTDQVVAIEMPFTLSGTTLTSNASNAFGILFDTAADNDFWHLVGVKADVDATTQNLAVAPVANTYAVWRLQITSAGLLRVYRNRALLGTAMTDAVTVSTLLTPVLAGFSREAVSKRLDCDYMQIRSKRA